MRRVFPWIVLAAALALAALLARHNESFTGALTSGDMASLAYKVTLLVVVSGAVLAIFRHNFSQALLQVMIWVVFAFVLVLLYTYRFQLHDVGERVLAELVPGHAVTRGHTVEFARASTGDFRIRAEVNGVTVAMVLDTGASSVVLTHDAAKSAGLPTEFIKYTVSVETANGHTLAAPVMLDRVAVGGIVERKVSALIAQPGQLRTSLLGMSFLNRLRSFEVEDSTVRMQGKGE